MFRSMWSKTLRDYRVAILAWGLTLALFGALDFAESNPTTLTTVGSLAQLFRFLGDPYQIQTPEGFISWRILELFVPLAMCIWPILAGARLVRGEEERGSMDVLLATPRSRARLLLARLAALLSALVLIGLLLSLGLMAGQAKLEGHATVARDLLVGLNVSLLAFFFGSLTLLFSQFTISRAVAASWASGLLVLSMLMDSTGRVLNGSWVQYLSPFYYYNLNRPLIPSFPDQPLAAVLLAGLTLLCIGASLILFARRDIGGQAFSWSGRGSAGNHRAAAQLDQAERELSTRNVFLQTLRRDGWAGFWWEMGVLGGCLYCLALALGAQKTLFQVIQQNPLLRQLVFDTPVNTNAAMLGTFLFTFMPALVVAFGLALALKWASDLENGRLEILFSTPLERVKVLLQRFGANVLLILIAPLVTWLVILLVAPLAHLPVNQGRIFAASFNMLPMALIIMSLVYAASGRLRYAPLVTLLSMYVALAFIEELLEGSITMPAWLMDLSIFHLYGNPVFLGVNWTNFLAMTAVALVLLGMGLLQFRRADIKLG